MPHQPHVEIGRYLYGIFTAAAIINVKSTHYLLILYGFGM